MKRAVLAVVAVVALGGCTTLTYDYAPHGQVMGVGVADPEKAQVEAISELIRVGGEFGIIRTSYGFLSAGLKHLSVYACRPGQFPDKCTRVDRAVASSAPLLSVWGSSALAAWGLRGSGDETNVQGGNAVSGSSSSSKAISKAEADAKAKAFLKQNQNIKVKINNHPPEGGGGCRGIFVRC